MFRHVRRLALAGCLLALSSAPALADEDVRVHNDRAMAAYALGHFAEAAEEYEKAFALKPQAALLYNAAQAHRLGANKQRALLLYQSYLRLYGRSIPNRAEVESHVVALKEAVESDARLTSKPPLATTPVMEPKLPPPAPEPATVEPIRAPKPVKAAAPLPLVPAAPADEVPLARRPILWVGVGGAVVVVAAVILIAVLAGSGAQDPIPSRGAVLVGAQ